MTKEDMMKLAVDLGFSDAVLVDTKEIPFNPAYRICCEDNSCGKYGVNWSCPPDCGSTDAMKARIQEKPRALLLQSTWDIEFDDGPAIKHCKGAHNRMTRELIAQLAGETAGFMVGASGCSLCEVCSLVEGMPCRMPEKMASCMSAYCIDVQNLAEGNGMEYDSGPGLVNFFGMYVFDRRDS